jgi:hypothetical protein
MPVGEEMFYYHGYSGPCPKPPLPKKETDEELSLFDSAAAHAVMGCLMLREGNVPVERIAEFADKMNDLIQVMRNEHCDLLDAMATLTEKKQ